MASPALDGNANAAKAGNGGSTSFTTSGITTNSSTGLAILVVGYETARSASQTVQSVTGGGLTWTKRSSVRNGNTSISANGDNNSIEIWTAPYASALSTMAATVTFTGTIEDSRYCLFAVTGLNSTSAPWDGNGSLPVTGSTGNAAGSAPTLTFSTEQADDLLIWATGTSNVSDESTNILPSGWTEVTAPPYYNGGGTYGFTLGVAFLSVSSTQSGATVKSQNANSVVWAAYVDALTADAPGTDVDLTGVSATSDAGTVSVEIDIDVTGVSSTSAAGTVTGSSGEAEVTGVAATGDVEDLALELSLTLTGALATGEAFEVSGNNYTIQGVEAEGEAGQVFSPVLLVGVFATGEAGIVRGPGNPVLPVYSIMTNTPVAVIGAMSNEPVAVIGSMHPSGPTPMNLAVDIAGVFATGLTIALWPSRNVRLNIAGVASSCLANVVAPF